MHLAPFLIIALGVAAVAMNSYILIDARKSGAIRDITFTPLPRAEDPLQYYYIYCRTLAYLVVGILLFVTGIWLWRKTGG